MLEFSAWFILWVVVSNLCIENLNAADDETDEWSTFQWWLKLILTIVAPLLYLAVKCKNTFETVFKK